MGKDRVAITALGRQVLGNVRETPLGEAHSSRRTLHALHLRGHFHRRSGPLSLRRHGFVQCHDGHTKERRVVGFRQIVVVHHARVDQALTDLRVLIRVLGHVLEDFE